MAEQVAPSSFDMARGFVRMPFKEKLLMFFAWCLMVVAAMLLRLVPFRRLVPLLGEPLGAVGFLPLVNDKQLRRSRSIRSAVLRASRISPFRSDCLPQALVAAVLCRLFSVPASIHLGVRLEDAQKSMAAHAWVCSGREPVTGGRSFNVYTPVSCFLIAPN